MNLGMDLRVSEHRLELVAIANDGTEHWKCRWCGDEIHWRPGLLVSWNEGEELQRRRKGFTAKLCTSAAVVLEKECAALRLQLGDALTDNERMRTRLAEVASQALSLHEECNQLSEECTRLARLAKLLPGTER